MRHTSRYVTRDSSLGGRWGSKILGITLNPKTLIPVAVAVHLCKLVWVCRQLRLGQLASFGLGLAHQGQISFLLRQVAGKQMVGVYLSVWVHRRLLPAVRGVQVTAVGTGVLGYLGNKGALLARTPQRSTLHIPA